MDLSHNPCGDYAHEDEHAHEGDVLMKSKHTPTPCSAREFCREMWEKQNVTAQCAVTMSAKGDFFSFPEDLQELPAVKPCVFYLTHDSYSSKEPQAPCRDTISVLGL